MNRNGSENLAENAVGEQVVAEQAAAPMLRYLRALVTSLAVVMGLGIIAIVAILWIRLGQAPLPELPATIALPAGATVEAVTFARNWVVVVTKSGEILLYDTAGQLVNSTAP